MEAGGTGGRGGSRLGWIAVVAAAGVTAWAVWDYSRWRGLGPGGLPANVRGWVTMCRFRLMAKDGLDVGPLVGEIRADDFRAWSTLRERQGSRPAISPYPVPHRQLDQLPESGVRAALQELFDGAALRHSGEVEYALSHFEKRHPAITLRVTERRVGARAHGEVAHIHPSDNSMHMILSPRDATAAIEAGWGERHGLAGIASGLPPTYAMIYAPRGEGDLQVIGELLDAAIAYAERPAG